MLTDLTDFTIRLRTWIIGAVGMFALFLPDLLTVLGDILNSPQIVAVLPENWKAWAGAIGFICLVWSRWRPATRTADAEVQVSQLIKGSKDPAEIEVRSAASGRTKAVIRG